MSSRANSAGQLARRLPFPISPKLDARVKNDLRPFLLIGGAILVASALGLASRHAFSVSFWPANAVLAGMVLRDRSLHRPAGWLGALLGFMSADLAFGRPLSLAAFFAVTNVVGSLTAALLLGRLDPRDLALRRVHSVMRILACLLPACFAAACCGAVLVTVQFDGSPLQALMTWPASELVNYMVALPAMLTVELPDYERRRGGPELTRLNTVWPAIFLAASCFAAVAFDGPGSIVFPLPALLLCALRYPVPVTAMLTMALGTGFLTVIGLGLIDIGQDMAVPRMVVSVRIAIAFLVLVPLTISSAMAVRDDLLNQLREAADHDGLTGLLNRRAFEQRMRDRLAGADAPGRSLAVLWLDIDHFKSINDRFGHLAGDAVLQAFAKTARACCRDYDIVGRLGGEEFALVVDVAGAKGAIAVAERLRQALAAQAVEWNGEAIRATVSIGACHLDRSPSDVLALVQQLDDALYRAKRMGRDRIEWLDGVPAKPAELRLAASA